jgi:hypothetical protein
LAHELGKLKPVIENPGKNPWMRLRLELGCKASEMAAYLRGLNKLSLVT